MSAPVPYSGRRLLLAGGFLMVAWALAFIGLLLRGSP